MARQILIINTDKNSEEINKLMKEFLTKNGYENKKYKGEEVLVKNAVPGFTSSQYMKIYIKDGVLKIVAWIKAFGKEYGVDKDFVACVPKSELKGILNSIVVLFNAQNVININTSDKTKRPLDNRYTEEFKEAKYELVAERKSAAIVSLVLGVIMLLCSCIPFPFLLALVLTISGIVIGCFGIRSSLKPMSIIGIILCSIDMAIYFLVFIGNILVSVL